MLNSRLKFKCHNCNAVEVVFVDKDLLICDGCNTSFRVRKYYRAFCFIISVILSFILDYFIRSFLSLDKWERPIQIIVFLILLEIIYPLLLKYDKVDNPLL